VREPTRVLGQLLIADGGLTVEQLNAALQEQQRTRERLGEILVRAGIDPESVARALSRQLRLPFIAGPLAPERAALALVDRAVAVRLRVVPLLLRDKALCVAMADPLDIQAIDDLQFRTGRRIEPLVASVRKTGRLLIVEEDMERGGVGGEIATEVIQRVPSLRIERLAAHNVGLPPTKRELFFLPTVEKIAAAARDLAKSGTRRWFRLRS